MKKRTVCKEKTTFRCKVCRFKFKGDDRIIKGKWTKIKIKRRNSDSESSSNSDYVSDSDYSSNSDDSSSHLDCPCHT